MGKFFNGDYEEVEAFTQEELDAKVKEAVEAAAAESAKKVSEAEAKANEATEAKTKLEEKLAKRSEEYNNLKTKFEEVQTNSSKTTDERKAAYEKMRDDMIAKAAGDDTEYAEALRAQYDRIGSESLDPQAIEKDMKDAHAMAMNSLTREFKPFSLSNNAGGKPPENAGDGADVKFTETEEGKASLNAALASVGLQAVPNDGE